MPSHQSTFRYAQVQGHAVERDSLLSCNIITLRTRLFCVCFRFICSDCSSARGWLQLLLVAWTAAHHDIVHLQQHNVTCLELVEIEIEASIVA